MMECVQRCKLELRLRDEEARRERLERRVRELLAFRDSCEGRRVMQLQEELAQLRREKAVLFARYERETLWLGAKLVALGHDCPEGGRCPEYVPGGGCGKGPDCWAEAALLAEDARREEEAWR